MAFGISAGVWAAGAALGGAALSYKESKDATKSAEAQNQAQIEANKVDPRITEMLFGSGTQRLKPGLSTTWGEPDEYGRQSAMNPQSDYTSDGGLLGQYRDLMNKPQSQAMQTAGQNAGNYLMQNGANDMNTMRNGALQQMAGIQAPSMQAAQMQATQMQAPLIGSVPMAQQSQIDMGSLSQLLNPSNGPKRPSAPPLVQAATVAAPSQNNLDLKDAYNSMIYGEFGKNPFLTGAIQKGINQSSNAFSNMQSDANRNMTELILPQLRGGAIASGQYGGTRQGIAEGRAVAEHAKETQRALTLANQYNTDAAVAAQAAAYREDADRAAALMQSLGGQQYGVANTNAANAQAASSQNAANQLQYMIENARLDANGDQVFGNWMMDAAKTNAGLGQQTMLANQSAILGTAQNNQQTQFGTNTNNMNAANGAATNNMASANSAANNNLQSQLSTNQLNSSNLQAGMAGLGGLLGNAYANAGAQDQYGMNQAIQGNSLLAPYLSKNGTPTQLQPVYNNSGSAALGGALAAGTMAYNAFGGSKTANPKAGDWASIQNGWNGQTGY